MKTWQKLQKTRNASLYINRSWYSKNVGFRFAFSSSRTSIQPGLIFRMRPQVLPDFWQCT
uniref:Uncharacterized protein n=1 Tax=Kuenenia stuttgartiensis TaxID=174633 RepID=Q1Q726_KUEST|nr:unknown protein [Candidatus Kuenenia stuttgartiensis]